MAEATHTPTGSDHGHGSHGGTLPRVAPPASDLNIRSLVLQTLGVVAAMVIAFVASTWLVNLITYLTPQMTMPANVLTVQLDPEKDDGLIEIRRGDKERLTKYDWINKDVGSVRIPIDRAITLIAQRGLPARTEAEKPLVEIPQLDGSAGSRSGQTLRQAQKND